MPTTDSTRPGAPAPLSTRRFFLRSRHKPRVVADRVFLLLLGVLLLPAAVRAQEGTTQTREVSTEQLRAAIDRLQVRHAAELGGEESRVTSSEMLPGPNEVWLPDAEGRRYTSELRVVALDH